MIGKIILGLCVIIAAVVIAKPEYADNAWSFVMGIFGLIGTICTVGIVAVVIIVIVILIWIKFN